MVQGTILSKSGRGISLRSKSAAAKVFSEQTRSPVRVITAQAFTLFILRGRVVGDFIGLQIV